MQYHLSTHKQHTVYKAEGIGMILALHLLKGLNRQINDTTTIGSEGFKELISTLVTTYLTRFITWLDNYMSNKIIFSTVKNVVWCYNLDGVGLVGLKISVATAEADVFQ